MIDDISKLSEKYCLTEDEFEEYYKKALLMLEKGKAPSSNKTLIIVGGQSGAGKTRLIPVSKRELNNNAITVDYDELRALHPNYKESRF